ncbi:MAG: hypothetical protein U0230_05180 [Polyangiales bacterium]
MSEIDDPTNSPRITPDLGLTKTGGADSFSFLEKLRIPNGDLEPLQTQKVVSAVYGSKPHKDAFFRTHPGPSYRSSVLGIKARIGGTEDVWLVNPSLSALFPKPPSVYELRLTITRDDVLSVWPLRYPLDPKDAWGNTAMEAAEIAQTRWIKLVANTNAGYYEAFAAMGALPDPVWPDKSFEELVALAFRDRVIDTANHPTLRMLRGEV